MTPEQSVHLLGTALDFAARLEARGVVYQIELPSYKTIRLARALTMHEIARMESGKRGYVMPHTRPVKDPVIAARLRAERGARKAANFAKRNQL